MQIEFSSRGFVVVDDEDSVLWSCKGHSVRNAKRAGYMLCLLSVRRSCELLIKLLTERDETRDSFYIPLARSILEQTEHRRSANLLVEFWKLFCRAKDKDGHPLSGLEFPIWCAALLSYVARVTKLI